MLRLVREMKADSGIKAGLNNLKIAFELSEYEQEAKLFYTYNQARNSNKVEKHFRQNFIDGYDFDCGYLKERDSGRLFSPWRDILNLWDFCGGEANE